MRYSKTIGNSFCITWYLATTANNKHSIYRLTAIKLNNLFRNILCHRIHNISCCISYFKCIYLLRNTHDIFKCYKSFFLSTCRHFNLFSSIKINKISLCNNFCYFITGKWNHSICYNASIFCETYIRCPRTDIYKSDIKKSVLFRNSNIHSRNRLECKACHMKSCIFNCLIKSVNDFLWKKCCNKFNSDFFCFMSLKVTYIKTVKFVVNGCISNTVIMYIRTVFINLCMCLFNRKKIK